MEYRSIERAVFLSRPNRFIAYCQVNGKEEVVHVKNTGRCRELLIPGTEVWLEPAADPNRKTKWSLVAVNKGGRLINIDSQAPNQIAWEAFQSGKLQIPGYEHPLEVRREVKFGESRLDFCLEGGFGLAYGEVKGVTLEENGVCSFPDAPTERGVRHIEELIAAKKAGYGAFLLFIVQMEGMKFLIPNEKTHPAFGEALREAAKAGVAIIARTCSVEPGSIWLDGEIPVYPDGIPGKTSGNLPE